LKIGEVELNLLIHTIYIFLRGSAYNGPHLIGATLPQTTIQMIIFFISQSGTRYTSQIYK